MSGGGARVIPANGLATWRKNTGAAEAVFGKLSFDGGADVSGQNVVIACVGPLTPIDDSAKAKYPILKTYPLIELAPAKSGANGAREAALYTLAPGYYGFGAARVPATLEWIDLRVITGSGHVPALLLRCTTPLAPGHYALLCGPNSYEIVIE